MRAASCHTQNVRDYRQQFCPISRGAEIFAQRWTPIIVRNLLLGCRTFGDIYEGAPGIPRTLLSERLRMLERYGILERKPNPRARGWLYELTAAGRDLQDVCDALGTWGARWLEAAPEGLDAGVLLWAIANFVDVERLPERRIVARFDLRDRPKERFWLVLQRPDVELCRKHPGFDEDLIVTAETEWLARWHMGRISLADAIREGRIAVDGPPALVRVFRTMGGVSPFGKIRPATKRVVASSGARTR